jgi:glucose-1-phosphate thymidylyltransferase
MKGVILAGGLGKRLYPLTKITNKHLLPVGERPMIFYPLQTLVKAGITEVLIVTGGQWSGDFIRLLGNGKDLGLSRLSYTFQDREGGIADALKLAEEFAASGSIAVILGDNIFPGDIKPFLENFNKQGKGARILLKEVTNPGHFGVAVLKDGKLQKLQEKPKTPVSPYAVTGLYCYDHQVFDLIRQIKPSSRGELEITDVNSLYLKKKMLEYDFLDSEWLEAGTFYGLLKANLYMARPEDRKRLLKELDL